MTSGNAGPGFEIVRFSRIRDLVIDVMIPAQRKHNIHIVFEADVTDVRAHLRLQKAEPGRTPSMTALLIKCTADAAMTNKRIFARRISARKLALYDDVHVNCMVESELDGESVPGSLIVRQANRKVVSDITEELANFSGQQGQEQLKLMRKFSKVPRPIRLRFLSAYSDKPERVVKDGFNVILTSVGMFGAGGGHIVPYTDASLCVGVGGIARKPGFVGDRIEPREYLSVTVTCDHDITDGAPAARFAQELKDRIEAGVPLLD